MCCAVVVLYCAVVVLCYGVLCRGWLYQAVTCCAVLWSCYAVMQLYCLQERHLVSCTKHRNCCNLLYCLVLWFHARTTHSISFKFKYFEIHFSTTGSRVHVQPEDNITWYSHSIEQNNHSIAWHSTIRIVKAHHSCSSKQHNHNTTIAQHSTAQLLHRLAQHNHSKHCTAIAQPSMTITRYSLA